LTWDTVDEEAYKAKQEAITISKRVTPAMRRRAKKGEVMQRRPIGYKRPGLNGEVDSGVTEKDEKLAHVIEELFRRYVEDEESLWSLTKWWNEETGIKKRPFGIRRLLENPFYCGANIHGRTSASQVRNDIGARPPEEWACGTHDCPIVSPEMWQKAQDRLAGNVNRGQQHREAEPKYPLTGLLLCSQDAKRLHGQLAAYYKDDVPTKRYETYHCPYCGKSKSNRKVEKALRGLLETIPLEVDRITAEASVHGSSTLRTEEIVQQIAKLQARRAKLMARWADATTPDEEQAAQDAIDLTDRELADLRIRQTEVAREQTADQTIAATLRWLEDISSWTEILDHATAAERNDVYRHLLSSLSVDFAANTLTMEWLPAIAKLTGQDVQTVSLATQPRRKSKKS
jgi:hypothetical protein